MRLSVVLVLATLAACSSNKQQEPAHEPPRAGAFVRGDAGITAEVVAIQPEGLHMDEGGGGRPSQPHAAPPRQGKPIDVTLRSTPPGAQVAVDGTVIGHTPAFWSGMADGREHEFVFTMRGHAIARYRFVPIASGVIHGRLDPIREETDAGMPTPPPEVVPPRPATSTINPPSAPPTIAAPPIAAPSAPPTVAPPSAPPTDVTDGGGPTPPAPGPAEAPPLAPTP